MNRACKGIGKNVVGSELRVVKKSEVVASRETMKKGTGLYV